MPNKKPQKILKIGTDKQKFISDRLDQFEELINQSSSILSSEIFKTFLDKLNLVDGIITSSNDNLSKVTLVDKAFKIFQEAQGIRILTTFANDMQDIIAMGKEYYVQLVGYQANRYQLDDIINRQLGINRDGSIKPEGYVAKLTSDPTMQQDLKKMIFKQVAKDQIGYHDLRKQIKNFIEGDPADPKQPGKFYSHYDMFAFDTYSQVDRLNARLHADRLGLKYFLYNGGTVKDSREFCVKNHGKVFSIEDAEKYWPPLVNKFEMRPGKIKPLIKVYVGPIMEKEKVDSYSATTDMGGLRCRHSCDYISDEVAEYYLKKEKEALEAAAAAQKKNEEGKQREAPDLKKSKPLPPPIEFESEEKRQEVLKDLMAKASAKDEIMREMNFIKQRLEDSDPGHIDFTDRDTFKLTMEETQVIGAYTGNVYYDLNRNLHQGKASDAEKAYEAALNMALDRVPNFEGFITRRLSVPDPGGKFKEFENNIGKPVVFDAFSSFTALDRTTSSFEKLVLVVEKSKRGKNLHRLTQYPGEKEVLYKSRAAFRILRTTKKTEALPNGGQHETMVVYLEEID